MKKRICSIFCMTILLMTLVFCLPAFAEETNLWYDGGFDNVNANGTACQSDDYRNFCGDWRHYYYSDGYIALCGHADDAPALSNAQSLNLSTSSSTYKLSVKIKNDTPGDTAYLKVLYDTVYNPYVWTCTELATFEGTDDWTTYEIELPSSANFIYFRSLHDTYEKGVNKWICVDDISVVETSTIEIVSGGLWEDSGFDALSVNGSNQAQNSDEYRYFSLPDWQSILRTESNNGNKYLCLRGSGNGNPIMRNKVAFEIDTTKKHVITFKAAEVANDWEGQEAKVYVYFSNEAIDSGFTLLDEVEAGRATAIGKYIPTNAEGTIGDWLEPVWEDVEMTIPAGIGFKYIYFLSPTAYLALDDISVVETSGTEEPEQPQEDKIIGKTINLAAPVANAVPQNTVTGTGYTGTVTWSPSVTDKFAYNTVYTATIKIATESGYTTAGIAGNGYTVSGADSVVNEKDSDTITVTFPSTGKKVITQTKVYEPYTLSYNSNHKDTGYYRSAPHAGWVLDNRGGPILDKNNNEYNIVSDFSTTEAVSFYKELNKVDEGVVTLETAFKITSGRDGFKICFTDEDGATVYSLETISGNFKVLQSNGTYRTLCSIPSNYSTTNIRVVVKLDFDNKLAHTYINDTSFSEDTLLSDNIMRFAYMTSKENTVTVNLTNTTKITANYYVNDDFLYYTDSTETVPYGWTSSNSTYAYVSASEGYVSNNNSLTKMLDTGVTGKVAFEGVFYAGAGANGIFELIDGEGNKVIDLTINGTNFTSSSTTVYSNYSKNIWNRFRIEADLVNHKALVKINGRAIKNGENDLYINIPADIEEVSGIKISGTTSTEIIFDDIHLFSLVEHDDYVPVPVLPTGDDYSVGINVCPLWSYESTHTWANIAPFEEFRPVLGYYDEGNPEVADWEIKMLAEHGVDFQAFCWYADNGNGPLKDPKHSMALHDGYMNAKYSNMMKYAIIWEAVSGTMPESEQAVYDYFVPYWIENYFNDDRYMTVDGKLIMYIYGYNYIRDDVCTGSVSTFFNGIKTAVKNATGKDLIIISVLPTPEGSRSVYDAGLDGESAYHWGKNGYNWSYTQSALKTAAGNNYKYKDSFTVKPWTIPTISTGFNDLPWVEGDRNSNMSVNDFKTGLEWIKNNYLKEIDVQYTYYWQTYTGKYGPQEEWQENLVMLSNWNEYGEGTYIMPSGLNGFGYLDAVREVFTNGSNANTHTDYTLTEAQLERIGKNYPQNFKPLRRTYSESIDTSITVNSELYIDGVLIDSTLKAEKTESGAIYFPFDAYWINSEDDATSIAHFLKLHYEWDWDWENGKLTLYGKNDTYAVFVVGSNTVDYHDGEITLSDAVYMRDGYPMLNMETVCEIFGHKYAYSKNNLYITTINPTNANTNIWPNETFDNANGLTQVAGYSSTKIANGVMHLVASSDDVYGIYRNTEALNLSGTSVLKFDYKSDSGDSSAYIQLAVANNTGVGPTNYHLNTLDYVQNLTSTWKTYEIEIPSTANYIYFRVRGSAGSTIDIDNVKVTAKQVTDAPPVIVAAGLKDDNTQEQSIAFAGYTAENNPEGFGFEISADNGKTVVIDTTGKVVATNGAFCKLDSLAGNFYIVSVNDIPARHFDCDLTVRAYAIFDNKVVYSESITASVSDVLNSIN